MDLRLDTEQQLLVNAARGFLARVCPPQRVRAMERDPRGYDPSLWREMAGLGWLRGDASTLDVALLLEEMGRALLPAPFVHTVVLAAPLLAARNWLDAIGAGELVATVAIEATVQADVAGDEIVLDGGHPLVAYAEQAELIVLSARAHDGTIMLVAIEPTSGVSCARRSTLHAEPTYDLAFNHVRVLRERIVAVGAEAERMIAATRARAALASLAFMVGAAERVLEMTVDYAKARTQFGRPIGAFQAVAHRCADMRSDIDALRWLVYQGAWCLGQGDKSTLAVSAAKAYGNEALRRIFMHAHQVHGAIGFSTEHDLHLYTRRAKAAELQWGSTGLHLEQVATAMGL